MDLFTHRVRRDDGVIVQYIIDRETGEIMSKWVNAREEVYEYAMDERSAAQIDA